MQILLLVALGLSLVVGVITKMPSADRRNARKLLAETPWFDDDIADGAAVKVTGVVKVREHGERFISPLSDNRCVVMSVRVHVRHGRDPRAKLVENFKIMPFVVENEGRKLLVDGEHALLDIKPVVQSRHAFSRKNQLLIELGFATANSARSEFKKTIVELGATVTVAGTLAKQTPRPDQAVAYRDTDPPLRIVGTKERPIAIKLERVTNLAAEP